MHKAILHTLLLGLFTIATNSTFSQKVLPEWEYNREATFPQNRAAACAPATALRDLEWNNVRALIETGGSLWHDRAVGRGSYEVPKGGGVSVMYGGALWLGGISPDQQLKIAAVRYRQSGNDYWPGPLTNDGSAEVDEAT